MMLLVGTAITGLALLLVLGLWGRRAGWLRLTAVPPRSEGRDDLHRLVLTRDMSFSRLRAVLARLGIDLVTSGPEDDPAAACWIEGSDRVSYVHAHTLGLRTVELEGPRAGRLRRALLRRLPVVTPDRLAAGLERETAARTTDEATLLWAVAAAAWQARAGAATRLIAALERLARSPLLAATAAGEAAARALQRLRQPAGGALLCIEEAPSPSEESASAPTVDALNWVWRPPGADADRRLPN